MSVDCLGLYKSCIHEVHITLYSLSLQEQYGTMAAVFCCNGDTTAVLAPFLPLGMGEMDCPKFVRSLDLCSVAAATIVSKVSFVLSCGRGRAFREATSVHRVEREEAELTGSVSFVHDCNNEVFILNCFRLYH